MKEFSHCKNEFINVPDNKGETPLISAAEKGYSEIAEILINGGCDIEMCNSKKMTALFSAVIFHHGYIVKLLMKKMKTIKQQDVEGKTVFHYVDKFSYKTFINVLSSVEKKNNRDFFDPNIRDKMGRTAAHVIAGIESDIDLECIKKIDNFDFNISDINGETPFQVALKRIGDFGMVEYMAGKVNKNEYKNVPKYYDYAQFKKFMEKWKYQMEKKDIFLAIAQNTKWRSYIDSNAFNFSENINDLDKNDCTPILIASKYGNISFLKEYLLQMHPNIFCCDRSQNNALHFAVANNHENVVELLLDSVKENEKKNFDKKNEDNKTPLAIACEKELVNIALKISKYANPEQKLGMNSPLFKALGKKTKLSYCIALDLIRKGFRIDKGISLENDTYPELLKFNDDGWTPLHYAVNIQQTAFIESCLDKEDVNAVNKDGFTPLHYAFMRRSFSIIDILIKWDVTNYEIKTREKQSYLQLAVLKAYECEKKMTKVIEQIISKCPQLIISCDVNGWNILHYSMQCRIKEVVEAIKKSANVSHNMSVLLSTKTKDSWYPIHMAVRDGNVEIVDMIIDGVDFADTHITDKVNIEDKQLTAIGVAYKYRNFDVIRKIIDSFPENDVMCNEENKEEIMKALSIPQ
jgi:ankyrin repeat protein